MHPRMLVGVALALALLLGACVDDPGRTILAPEDATFAKAQKGGAAELRLMSRNLYLGADIDHVLIDPAGGPDIAWAEIQYTDYPSRAPILAREIVDRMPHLIGLQEVSRYTLIDPATMTPALQLDWLHILVGYLHAYGAPYQVVERAYNFNAYLPMGGYIVHYLDGDAILALPGVDIHDSGWRHFLEENQVDLDEFTPIPLGLGYNLRSFQWADVTVEGQRLLFLNTHLEVQRWAAQQEGQAAEILEFVDGYDGAVVMVGDFNSAANRNAPRRANTATYDMMLDAGFDDLWLPHNGVSNSSGPSCCQVSDLSNRASELDERIDFIFARGLHYWKGNRAASASLSLVGHRPSDRFLAPGGYHLWPSDHAGLFGAIKLSP
jgi:endonuclease/exonuclease/phosphatase family metal-dependent hydrolase